MGSASIHAEPGSSQIDANLRPLVRVQRGTRETRQRLSLSLIAHLTRIVVLAVLLTVGGVVASAQAHEGHVGSHAVLHDYAKHLSTAAGGIAAVATIRASFTHRDCHNGMHGCPSCYVGAACCSPAVIGDGISVVGPSDRGRRITSKEPPILSGLQPEGPAEPPRPFNA